MMVGRDVEFARAVRALRAGHSVLVTGQAGIGKTALVDDVAAALDRTVLTGQCFRSLLWSAAVPLQQALGVPIPVGDASWTARAVRARIGASVLRLEDAQWADPVTREVVALLAAQLPVVVTVRLGDPGTSTALAAFKGVSTELIDLGPLDADAGADLARSAHPRLRETEVDALVRRSGGIPLLIEELGGGGPVSSGLRRSIVARLGRLGEDAWRTFAMIALAGEPVPADWFGCLPVLVDAGLVTVSGPVGERRALPRHALFAETVLEAQLETAPDELAALFRRLGQLAERSDQVSLAARCHSEAGDHARAVELAVSAAAAATRPGDRAALLHVAAGSASAEGDLELAIELAETAVEQLVAAGEYDRAVELIAASARGVGPRWLSLVGRVRWQRGDDLGALAAYREGLAIAEPGTREHVMMSAEYARAVLLAEDDPVGGLALAREAVELADRHDLERARAIAVLGTAEHYAGDSQAAAHLREAVELAAEDGDVALEFTSANNLIGVLEADGDLPAAIAQARRGAERAEQLRLGSWQVQMAAMALNAAANLGDYDVVVAEVPGLLAGVVDRRTREQLEVTLGMALVDLGRLSAAALRIEALLPDAVEDYYSSGSLRWVLAEARLWSGEPESAIDDCERALAVTPRDSRAMFPLLTRAHAQLALGKTVDPDRPQVALRIAEGAAHEYDALVALSNGDRVAAEALFERAAKAWAGCHRRGELRCRWLAADCSSDDREAREALVELEQQLALAGWTPLLGQVRRSLRSRGVRSAVPRTRPGALSAREREVLELVAEGLSTDAIAARLGLSGSTIAAHVASARTKLGVASRWQAIVES